MGDKRTQPFKTEIGRNGQLGSLDERKLCIGEAGAKNGVLVAWAQNRVSTQRVNRQDKRM